MSAIVDLWSRCGPDLKPSEIAGELLRLVESQEQVATSSIVDDLAEQVLLEDLLEPVKPPLRPGTESLHYLLASPFRYPPLRYGSRFGSRFEPSLFYGALSLQTVLAEAAYYRLVFWTAMAEPPPAGRLLTQHTVFRARYRSPRGLRLQDPPCDSHATELRHPSDYGPTQALGHRLREMDVEAIEYGSARDPSGGQNVGLFSPAALASRRPLDPQPWLCETRASRVAFSGGTERAAYAFPIELFQVEGRLPLPAI
ncbi:MAG: RES family NAD+ phosphorylase [Chromatiaceae bacterium]